MVAASSLLPTAAFSQGKSATDDAYLYFVWPQDGAVIKGGFWCRFGLRNMGVTHAGDDFPNAGHHHLLIDVDEPLDPNDAIPQDKNRLHFGAGQTEARIELPPGKHTLQLVLGTFPSSLLWYRRRLPSTLNKVKQPQHQTAAGELRQLTS
jgi:Domain of unknown function (DUF4399)